ncbi:MAG: Fe-S-cluster containining protein, partial [Paracoccaceae bacterium]
KTTPIGSTKHYLFGLILESDRLATLGAGNLAETHQTRSTRFSYKCQACNRCCYDKLIQVNPFELLHMSYALEVETTKVLERYLVGDAPYLKKTHTGACVFLGASGCRIHKHRPAVCRIYPLGKLETSGGKEYFVNVEPAINSQGQYGSDGTIADYIASQQVDPYFDAGAKCLALQHRIVAKLAADTPISAPNGFGNNVLDWIDVDKIIGLAGEHIKPLTIEAKLDAYIEILDSWLKPPANTK